MRPSRAELAVTILSAGFMLLALLSAPQPTFSGRTAAAVEHWFDKFTGPVTTLGDEVYSNNKLAQSFTANETYKITKIAVFVWDKGSNDWLTLGLFSDMEDPGSPGKHIPGALMCESAGNGNITGYEWLFFPIDCTLQIILNAGTKYWIVLNDTENQQNNGYSWMKRDSSPLYPYGDAASCPGANCQSWSIDTGADYLFVTYGIAGPSISAWAEVDSPSAGAGDPLRYTVYFVNSGSEMASKVWINMTLSGDLSYEGDDSASIGGKQTSPPYPNWLFENVTLDAHQFNITVRVSLNVYDGLVLTASFTLQYANRFGNMQEDHSFQVTAIARVPSLQFSKSVSPTSVDRAGILLFTLTFTNVGSRPAEIVWINDTIPSTVTYGSDTAGTTPKFVSRQFIGNLTAYTFSDVTPGFYEFEINVTVESWVLNGTEITNCAALSYTDSSKRIRGPILTCATARVVGASIYVEATTLDTPVAGDDTVRYEVSFENKGNAQAAVAWVNATLPQGVTYADDNAADDPNFWDRVNVGRDWHYRYFNIQQTHKVSLIIATSVDSNVTDGQLLTFNVCLNYTDWDWKLLTPSCARTSAVVMIPNLSLFPQGPSVADPGDFVDYSALMNNTGSGLAKYVWVNVSWDQYLSPYFDNSSLIGGLRIAPHTWRFDNVTRVNIAWGLSYSLSAGLPDGHSITTCFDMDFTDYKGRALGSAERCVVTIVTAPVVAHVLVQNKTEAKREDTIVYTVYYNNTGNGVAGHVWINDTIPDQTIFRRSSDQYASTSGSRFTWHFTGVAKGPHNMTITVAVDNQAGEGSILANSVDVTYTDANGNRIDKQVSTVSVKVVNGGGDGGTGPNGSNTVESGILWVLIISLLLVLVAMWLFVGRKFYGLGVRNKARIDELLLLHRSGELIRHHSRSLRPDVDSDVLSAMLVAVQNFVRESFNFRPGDLEELKFGNQKIILIHGEHAIMAAVVSGSYPQMAVPGIRKALEEIEKRFGTKVERWSGMNEDLPSIDDVLSRVFTEKPVK